MQDVKELLAQIAQLVADKTAIEMALVDAQAQALVKTRQAVEQTIAESGFARADVLGMADEPADPGRVSYALQVNPDLVYTRGRMPQWLKASMIREGFAPDKPAERKKFRDQHMTEVRT